MCCAGWESAPHRLAFLLVLLGGHFGTCWNAPGFEANSAYATKQRAVSPSKKRCYQHKTNILSSKCVDKCFGPWWKPILYGRNTQPLSRFQQTPLYNRSKQSPMSVQLWLCNLHCSRFDLINRWTNPWQLFGTLWAISSQIYPRLQTLHIRFKSTEIHTSDWKETASRFDAKKQIVNKSTKTFFFIFLCLMSCSFTDT